MDDRLKKTERLIKIWVILHNNPRGYTIRELVERFQVGVRTIYRDLAALQSDLNVPVYDDDKRWKLNYEEMLPPIRFTVPEALNVFLAVRLMAGYDKHYDPNMDATFSKLGTILPQPLAEQVQRTVDWMHTLTRDDRYLHTLSELARSWVAQRCVKITYRALDAEKAIERTIEPYFIEPAATGHASYVVAYCHHAGAIRNFKIGRIESIRLTDETYTFPLDFDANKYFSPAWGVSVEGEAKTIHLKFAKRVARLVEETVWHPSQFLEKQRDGSLIMTLQVMDTIELFRWILWWGDDAEVLEPTEIRDAVIEMAEAVKEAYKKKRKK